MHKPTTREIDTAARYMRAAQARGDRVFDATSDGLAAMNGGWRAARYAHGWLAVVRERGEVARPFRQSRPLAV